MAETTNWSFPTPLQPDAAEVDFDLARALTGVVRLASRIPDDAFTAQMLGTAREGNGVVIRDNGLIVTIGYLITEAEAVWITTHDGRVVPGHPLAYDFATGLGLVLPLGPLGLPAVPMGTSTDVDVDDDVFVIGSGGRAHALKAQVFARREFAGYWEYLLDVALFTSPPHPEWSGAALLDGRGRLIGIGSLLVQEQVGDDTVQGNMFVPIDLLPSLVADVMKVGRSSQPPRPWLGMYTTEISDHVVVHGLAKNAPADNAGVRLGDIVVDVGGEKVSGLGDLYRKIWQRGAPGAMVPITLARHGTIVRVQIQSADRNDYLRKPQLQ